MVRMYIHRIYFPCPSREQPIDSIWKGQVVPKGEKRLEGGQTNVLSDIFITLAEAMQ